MRLVVDESRCQGHTLCKFAAPQLFELREEDGHSVVVVDVVPPDQEERARMAAAGCPEQAITIHEDRADPLERRSA